MHLEKDLVLLGVQGSGKGTQAKRIAEATNAYILGTGDLFRSLATTEDPLAQEVRGILASGGLISDDIVAQLVAQKVATIPGDTPIIFDGFPRNKTQWGHFVSLMEENERTFAIVFIELPREEAFTRILSRGKIEGREDDQDETSIRNRIDTYYEATLPLVEEAEEEVEVIRIDGRPSIEEVTKEIQEKML